MGFNISWLAIQACDRVELHRSLGLVATGDCMDFPQGPVCGAILPNAGYLLILNDPWHPYTEASALAKLSLKHEIYACRIEEHNMSSAAFAWKDGTCTWSVVHSAERDVRNLKITGNAPVELAALRDAATRLQDKERKPFFLGWMRVQFDHFFQVPIDLAAVATGYQHDLIKQPWGIAKYEALVPGALH